MKKIQFDILMIVLMAVLLLVLNQFDLLEESAKFGVVALLVFYWLGKYSERKFSKK
ncbi:MAG TPA: hypothetical protein VK916_03000 [Gillisia sp.]|nr:hypothetical protein [Gillisia sp.]